MGGHPDLKGSVVGLNSAAEERTTPKLVMVKKKINLNLKTAQEY